METRHVSEGTTDKLKKKITINVKSESGNLPKINVYCLTLTEALLIGLNFPTRRLKTHQKTTLPQRRLRDRAL
ncbi:CLUMA_CG021457, isoform A [Clunio marinus]|uniref:CLUMA_CG021457, isoform A n=1 Tax=Clunio marinus TaxID=568069 RepID=A0A1J1J947_9DIPT|nr:CLUMA_CG021457, isoform A [Clunio marinus]